MTRWSSISFTSFRASSTGCTFVRNARPKTPSKRDSILCSMLRRTLIAAVFPAASSLTLSFRGQDDARGPGREDERDGGCGRGAEERPGEEDRAEGRDSPAPVPAGERKEGRGRAEDERDEQELRPARDRVGQGGRPPGRLLASGQVEGTRGWCADEGDGNGVRLGHEGGAEDGRDDLQREA